MSKQVRFAEPEEPTHGKRFKHTLDSDEEDDEVNEEHYNIMSEDAEGGFESATVEFDGQIQITPFNLDEELETGHFDKDGTYIFKKENAEDRDNWLSNIDWSKVKQRSEEDKKQDQQKNDDDESSDSEEEADTEAGKRKQRDKIEELYKKIMELVLPGETIQKAIQRFGKNCPRVQRGNNNKRKQQQSDANDPEKIKAKENMLMLSTLADDVLSTGDMDIYERTYEEINLKLKCIADDKEEEEEKAKAKDAPIEEDMFA